MSFERRSGPKGPNVGAWLRGRPGRAVLVALAMFLVGYAAAAQWMFPAANDPTDVDFTEVPDLTGLTSSDAQTRITDLGFVAAEGGRLTHADVAAGAVIAQSPLPGQVAQAGDTISLTLSAGLEARTIPDLSGLAGDEAATLLRRLGFDVDVERIERSSRAGVIESTPPAGTRLDLPATVELVVSAGRAIVEVPDLRGRHADDLEDILTEAQLRLGAVSYQVDAPEGPGRVVSQSPAPGSSLRGDGIVSVVVAGTPPDSVSSALTDEVEAARDSTGGTR